MATVIVPPFDADPWPSLGGQVCDLIEDRAVFGPGSLKGKPAVLDDEKRAAIWKAYEVYPRGHELAGRRRFRRVRFSWRKGSAKTEIAAWIAFVELHPDGPVRFDGWDADGNPVGRPVVDPYIPLLAYTQGQVAELAYGALFVVCTEGPDADLFDAGLERIIRLGPNGEADGKAVPLSNSPGARDGSRTTCNIYDETHRLELPRQIEAYNTMEANLPKRPLDDPWSLGITTAGVPGSGSVAEIDKIEAEAIQRGEIEDPEMFYFHREAGPGYDLRKLADRIEAVREASGPAIAAWSDLRGIAKQWDRPGVDKPYLERVWLNRWVRGDAQAFDMNRWAQLQREPIDLDGRFVTIGFDGARFRDSTGFVVTDILTGLQVPGGLWERDVLDDVDTEGWEIDEGEVTAALESLMSRYEVWRLYGDPPHWTETMGSWSGRWPDQVEEWWTNRPRPMAMAVQAYVEGIASGAVGHDGDPDLARHLANSGRHDIRQLDDFGQPLWTLRKLHPERKIDLAMCAVLSWRARLDAIAAGAKPSNKVRRVVRRIR